MQSGAPETETVPGYIPAPDLSKDASNQTSTTKKNPYHDKMNVKGSINHSDEDFRSKKHAQLSACSSSTMDSFIQDVPYVPSPIAVQYDPNIEDAETPPTTQDSVEPAQRSRQKRCMCCESSCSLFGVIFLMIIVVAFTFAFIAL